MKIAADWVSSFVEGKLSARQVAEALEMAGVEIEQIKYAPEFDERLIVVRVKKVVQHPEADRLKLATVVTDSDETQVVCGAPNLETGQVVVLAGVGSVLPDGTEISEAKIRGVVSNGMLCSAAELGVSDDHEGIMVLPEHYQIGRKLCDIWKMPTVLDTKTAANRSDLMSAAGLGREVGGLSDRRWHWPAVPAIKTGQTKIEVLVGAGVRRYGLVKLEVNNQGETPGWMRDRLVASGVRPISLVVDITNYVMLELGQPLHAFDSKQVELPVSAGPLKAAKELTTLDGVKRQLQAGDLVINDKRGVIALAGVMGGEKSEVSQDTGQIYLEAATFDPAKVRKTALRLGLRTEASSRFERGLPVELAEHGLRRAVELLLKHAQAKVVSGLADIGEKASPSRSIVVPISKITSLYGRPVLAQAVCVDLQRLGFSTKLSESRDEVMVEIPWWRPDVRLAEDIVEEVARVEGYDKVPSTVPAWKPEKIEFDNYWPKVWELKGLLVGLGLFEVQTYSFVSRKQLEHWGYQLDQHLKLRNPKSTEQEFLRTDLLPSMLDVVARNQNYSKEFGIFELSKVYRPLSNHAKLPAEPRSLAVAVRHPESGYRGVKAALDLIARQFGVTARVEVRDDQRFHPGRGGTIRLSGKPAGVVGELHPQALQSLKITGSAGYLEINFDELLAAARPLKYRELSRYPSVLRDIAVVVDTTVTWSAVEKTIGETKLAFPTFVSDYYGRELGPGRKSLAVRLEMVEPDRTLTDREADERVGRIVERLRKEYHAELR